MTTDSSPYDAADRFLECYGSELASGSVHAIGSSVVRNRSALGRRLLMAHASTGTSRPRAVEELLVLPDEALDPAALCELAWVLTVRPIDASDPERALKLYDRAAALAPGPLESRHRETYLRLAVRNGDRARIERLLEPLSGVPDELVAAVGAELAHPASGGDETDFIRRFGRFAGWDGLGLDGDDGRPMLDRLHAAAPDPVEQGPLVSIIMTCHRPGPELLTAVRSVAAQTWQRWELLLIDDASGPGHETVLEQAAALDPRIELLRRPTNGGTYRARNLALARARGEFVTGLDSDDWASPRWLEEQAAPLLEAADLVMTMSNGVRATEDLRLFTFPGRRLSEARSTSIMFRAEPVRSRIGFFDVSRKGADSEFRLRIQKAFGSRRWRRLEANHTIVRQQRGSLSGGEVGDGWMHPLRAVYEASFHHWHREIQQKKSKPFLEASAPRRPFPAPAPLLGEAPQHAAIDRIYLADWRYEGPQQRAMLAELESEASAGRSVAIAHYQSWCSLEDRYIPIARTPLHRAAALGVEWADLGAVESAEVVAADESLAAAIEVDFPSLRAVRVMAPASGADTETLAAAPKRTRRVRVRSGLRPLARLPRRMLRGKRAALRRFAGRTLAKVRRALHRRRPSGDTVLAMPEWQAEELRLWTSRLHEGWSEEAIRHLTEIANDARQAPAHRLAAMEVLADWYDLDAAAERRVLELDVVVVSNFMLPGGSSSSSAEEIRAFRQAGLRVGLVHHPVYDWPLDRPLNHKIRDLLADDGVVWISARDTVRCDLAIVRFPRIMMRPMDDLPEMNARRTILVVNQPPYEYYGPTDGRRLTWDIRTVHKNLRNWLGEHTWYPQGPVVRGLLEGEHAAEMDGIDLADDYWYGVLDVEEWRRERRRADTGTIRIGRHARDHVRKWPESAEEILACYPASEDFEIHVLGGAKAARRILRRLPENWTVLPFGSMQPKEFLHGLDVVVFFIAESGDEAFGRTPLEAMAVGLPCVLPRSFEPLFGDGAVYCEPWEVQARVRELMDHPELYAEQAERAVGKVERDFSYQALLRRAAALGVGVEATVVKGR
ncbi:glycosyltransferase [Glycomyces tarimensis]